MQIELSVDQLIVAISIATATLSLALILFPILLKKFKTERAKFYVMSTSVAIASVYLWAALTAPEPLTPAKLDMPRTDDPEIFWVDTGTLADWGGRDYAYTAGSTPKYKLKSAPLCDANHIGFVATCWWNRPEGYPPNIATDVEGTRPDWCTYKDNRIKLSSQPDGRAKPGRVYICTRVIARQK